MSFPLSAIACAIAASTLAAAGAQAADDGETRPAGIVVVTGSQPSSLPTRLPTTIEGVSRADIARSINATDSEDALKYLPSLLVRKRYPGDYNHAVLSTRASGTGNSARSLVYADGVLLSNLLGNGATFAPRWGLVAPEEIERVDVLYGPFSAAYSGNAVGAVVDIVTRLPQRFEAHGRIGAFRQPHRLHGTDDTFGGEQASVSLGDRAGDFAWWIHAKRLRSHGQPQTFATRLPSQGTVSAAGLPVTGAVADHNPRGQDWLLLGSATEYDTTQDHLKARLAWDITPVLRANLLLGAWRNTSDGSSRSWLRDAEGRTIDHTSSGGVTQAVNIDGRRYLLAASDFGRTHETLQHGLQAFTLKSNSRGRFDGAISLSRYRYGEDRLHAYAPNDAALPQAGRLTDLHGTGWTTAAARGTWRPGATEGDDGAHVIDAGFGEDEHRLRQRISSTRDWLSAASPAFASRFEGRTRIAHAFVQDTWRLAADVTSVLGLRAERWTASEGLIESLSTATSNAGLCDATTRRCTLVHAQRQLDHLSPKAALSWQLDDAWGLKASTGRAVRYPTVSELYQGGFNAAGQAINNDPSLKPERSWTSELSAERVDAFARLRATLLHEDTRDALYSQLNPATNANTVQNVDHVRTTGLEFAASSARGALDRVLRGLTLQGSVTYADSRIVANRGYLLVPGDTVGRQQPRVPRWRATLLANWEANDRFSLSGGARYSGRQYSALDNGDFNGASYMGASPYLTTDLRATWRLDRQWRVAAGIDNLNNARYWNFHPYPQRTYSVELSFDL